MPAALHSLDAGCASTSCLRWPPTPAPGAQVAPHDLLVHPEERCRIRGSLRTSITPEDKLSVDKAILGNPVRHGECRGGPSIQARSASDGTPGGWARPLRHGGRDQDMARSPPARAGDLDGEGNRRAEQDCILGLCPLGRPVDSKTEGVAEATPRVFTAGSRRILLRQSCSTVCSVGSV